MENAPITYMNNTSYIKTDDNKIINEKQIRWVNKMNECLEVCTKPNGCSKMETHRICKNYSLDSYNRLNKYFD
jgi:hypothetical protein